MDRRGVIIGGLAVALGTTARADTPVARLIAHAKPQTKARVSYDPAYTKIPYPMGDVAADKGVCTDVIIRAYRHIGIDLQKFVHEDMRTRFADYPPIWGLKRPDSNIDHRRVPNLEVFFNRFATRLKTTQNPEDYASGDVVTYRLNGSNLPHIALVSDELAFSSGKRYQIIHNIGAGPKQEDQLFAHDILGHYRYRL